MHTGSPSSAAISARVVIMASPARTVIESTCSTVTSRSPATIGRWWVNRSSACTTRLKSIPAAGSSNSWASARWATTTANVGGAMTSGYPSARATDGSVWAGWEAPTASANSCDLLRGRPRRRRSAGTDDPRTRRRPASVRDQRVSRCSGVTVVAGAELLQLEPVGVVATVLLGDVVPLLALRARERDLGADVRRLLAMVLPPLAPGRGCTAIRLARRPTRVVSLGCSGGGTRTRDTHDYESCALTS